MPNSKRPHIVLITIDTLAANHASLYGYGRPTTPNLERLAREATVFERFYANSNFTTATVNSFIHGVRPWTHRANQLKATPDFGIAEQGLVARLRRAGYQTFAVSTNPWAAPFHVLADPWFDRITYGKVHRSVLIAQSEFFSRFPSAVSIHDLSIIEHFFALFDWLLVRAHIWSLADHHDPELAFSAARRFAETRDPAKPMFLWVHLLEPHDPYATQAPFVGRFDSSLRTLTRFNSTPPYHFSARRDESFPDRYVGRYDEAIASIDHHVGLFIDWLKKNGLFDNTLLVVSADHGESFSHNYGGHAGPMLHEDLIRIPLIVKGPGQSVGKRLDVVAEQIDLMPTLLELADIPIEGPVEGRSLKPAIWGERMEGAVFSMNLEQSSRFGEWDTGSVAMIEGRWKYIHYRGKIKSPLMPKLEDSLYDLQADPDENTNLVTAQPAIAAKMLAVIQEQLRRHSKLAQ